MFHKAAHFVLSPSTAFKIFVRWFSSSIAGVKGNASVPTATLGDNDPTPTERNLTLHHALNTDARTCQDFITEHG